MILVADSGSSKCDWVLTDGQQAPIAFKTAGLNPNYVSEVEIVTILSPVFKTLATDTVTHLFFYGAGCSTDESRDIVKNAMARLLKNAEIKISHDLEGSAIATCGNDEGIACILGTGSNVCHWDGHKIKEQIPVFGMGYILGDDGSGSHLGKTLLRKFLYNELPQELRNELLQTGLNKDVIVEHTYLKPGANVFIAGFSEFVAKHIAHPFINEMVMECFDTFFKTHILKYSYQSVPVNFVGSIAYVFSDQLKAVAKNYGAEIKTIIRQPIERLVTYHLVSLP
ncbi:MAG: N-acetylglucosamine kinase [Bacteroidota bacterium]